MTFQWQEFILMVKVGDIFKSNNYGYFEIIEYHCCYDILIKFKNTGFELNTNSQSIKIGTVK